jgi:hypothetical protein
MTVRVTENASGARGEVVAVSNRPGSTAAHEFFNVSKSEFEQMWSTLNAPGVDKRLLSGSKADLNYEYLFQSGKQSYAVKKTSSASAVSVLSARLRRHAQGALKLERAAPASPNEVVL